MLQFILAAAVALCAQPTDAQVMAAIPETGAVRTDVSIAKYPVWNPLREGRAGQPALQWQCVAYYTEVRQGAKVRRVQIVYLDAAGKSGD